MSVHSLAVAWRLKESWTEPTHGAALGECTAPIERRVCRADGERARTSVSGGEEARRRHGGRSLRFRWVKGSPENAAHTELIVSGCVEMRWRGRARVVLVVIN